MTSPSAYYDLNHHGSFYSPHKEAVVNLTRAPSAVHFSRHLQQEQRGDERQQPVTGSSLRPSTSLNRLYHRGGGGERGRGYEDSFRESSHMRPWEMETTSKRDFRYWLQFCNINCSAFVAPRSVPSSCYLTF
jgi:hypothetical protein